jgi:ElaB/YqjD/DUF883 family membrane-anchored ribosome-binding protein
MDPQPEVIREQIENTRDSLTEKLQTLEDQVKETVSSVRSKVEGTVEAVSNTVKSSVESVKNTFDIPEQTRRHPHAMVGGAFGVGALLGWMTMRRRSHMPEPYWSSAPEPEPAVGRYEARSGGGWFSNMLTPLAEEMHKIKATGLGFLIGLTRDAIVSRAPEGVAERLREIVDNMTRRAGATVMPSPVMGRHQEPQRETNP